MCCLQTEGVQRGLARGGRLLLADEPGLGKTVQALALLAAFRDEWPALIICPKALRDMWADKAHEWLRLPARDVAVACKEQELVLACERSIKVVIVSYDLIRAAAAAVSVQQAAFQVVVCDESHYLKNATVRSRHRLPSHFCEALRDARSCAL